MKDVERLTLPDLVERAARGAGKVHYQGAWAVLNVSEDEIEAMALMLVTLGVAPIPPGTAFSEEELAYLQDLTLGTLQNSQIVPIREVA